MPIRLFFKKKRVNSIDCGIPLGVFESLSVFCSPALCRPPRVEDRCLEFLTVLFDKFPQRRWSMWFLGQFSVVTQETTDEFLKTARSKVSMPLIPQPSFFVDLGFLEVEIEEPHMLSCCRSTVSTSMCFTWFGT